MTLPAYCKLALCPRCGGEKEIVQIMSGNTYGAWLWSDSKQVAPMLPQVSPIQKCPTCGHYYFLKNVNIKEGDTYSDEEGWLSFDDAIEAFNELMTDYRRHIEEWKAWSWFDKDDEDSEAFKTWLQNNKQKDLELLTIIIAWAFNDIIRNGKEPSQEQYDVFKTTVSSNLKQPILSNNELLKAELYREIGEFDECLATLEKFNPEDEFLADIRKRIIDKAQEQDDKVFVIIKGWD